jgi:hypothetical protein
VSPAPVEKLACQPDGWMIMGLEMLDGALIDLEAIKKIKSVHRGRDR